MNSIDQGSSGVKNGDRGEEPPPAGEPPPAAAAKKSSDVDSIRKAVEDGAAVSTGLWISYIFTLFYIAIAAGAVSHIDLLLESPVRLPFLGLELPLLAFFFLAPLLFLVAHAYTLVHFVMLGKKATLFNAALYAQYPRDAPTQAESERNHEIRESIRRQLPSNIFVQVLAGARDVRHSGFGVLLRIIAWVTLVFAPIALLFELQVQFLPFHHLGLTWEHRVVLLLDMALIWWLWRKIFDRGGDAPPAARWRPTGVTIVAGALSAMTVWLSCSLATIPGEWQTFTAYRPLHAMLFHGLPDPSTHRPSSPFSNILVLPYLNVYDILKVDDPQKTGWREYLLSLRGRDLRGAIFDEAIMERTDAQSVQLLGASLNFVRMQASKLDEASLQGADFSYAQLQGASLLRAKLQGAKLDGAGLQGAKIELESLVGADLSFAQLQGANFRNSDLRGADFTMATFRGTSFANLPGDITQLQGAKFDKATLDTISLNGALLWRASFAVASSANILGTPVWTARRDWGPQSYAELRDSLAAVPRDQRGAALQRIESVACAVPPGTPACIVPSPLPPDASGWSDDVRKATVDRATYQKSLAAIYRDLVCSGDRNSLAIFRSLVQLGVPQAAGGVPRSMGFLDTGSEVQSLVEYVMSDKCPMSSQLTLGDKAALLGVQKFSAQLVSNTRIDPPTPSK
jgi:uncharacterized protein YjbI with pentapeptide repeats